VDAPPASIAAQARSNDLCFVRKGVLKLVHC
jgi:hypothetical protein